MGRGRDIRIVIADGQPVYRDGLMQSVAREGFAVVGVCEDGRSALDTMVAARPHVAVVDLGLCHLDGVQLASAAADLGLETRVVVLSASPEPPALYDALAAGAAGFLSKRSSAEDIRHAVMTVAAGGTFLGPELHAGIATEIRVRRSGKPGLSRREREILRLAAEGYTAREMGAELFIGAATVRTHLQNAYEKLGVRDKGSAIAEAMRRGLVT